MQLSQINAALVTGAGSGMGRATAKHLSANGVNVICVDIQADAVQAVADEIHGYPLVADVSSSQQMEKAITKAVADVGEIRVAVNCAGVIAAGRIVGKSSPMPLDDFSHAIQINLMGSFNVMRLAAYHMSQLESVGADNERGVIINTSSVAAEDGQLGQTAYSASKGAVQAMTLPAARELSRFGIRVMTIAPGIMETPMMANLTPGLQDSLSQQVCYPKRLGQAKEYAILVQHVIENAYLNASTIRLDGGIRMQTK